MWKHSVLAWGHLGGTWIQSEKYLNRRTEAKTWPMEGVLSRGPGCGYMPKSPYVIMLMKLIGGVNVCLDPWRSRLCYLKIVLQIQLFAAIFTVYSEISLRNSSAISLPIVSQVSLSKRRKMQRSIKNTHCLDCLPPPPTPEYKSQGCFPLYSRVLE